MIERNADVPEDERITFRCAKGVRPDHLKPPRESRPQRPGNTCVFSFRTLFNFSGLIPRTLRMVGAICRVSTSSFTIAAVIEGFETRRATLRSSLAKPPC